MKGIFNKTLSIALLMSVAGVYAGGDVVTTEVVNQPVLEAVKTVSEQGRFASIWQSAKDAVTNNPKKSIGGFAGVSLVGAGLGVEKYNSGVSRVVKASGPVLASTATSLWSYAPSKETVASYVPSMETMKEAGKYVVSPVANHPYIAGGVAAYGLSEFGMRKAGLGDYTPSHGVYVAGKAVKDVVVATPGYVTTKVVSNPKMSIAAGSVVGLVGAGLGVEKYNSGVSRIAKSLWSYAPSKETVASYIPSKETVVNSLAKCIPAKETVVATVKAQNLGGKIGYATLAAGLGLGAYKYGLFSKTANLFKAKEDSLVTYWKQQLVEMKRISVALEGTDAIEVNMHCVLPRDKQSFNETLQAFNDNQNDETKAALKAFVDGIIVTAEMMLK